MINIYLLLISMFSYDEVIFSFFLIDFNGMIISVGLFYT